MAGEKDMAKGNLKEMQGNMRKWWGKLTDDDLEQAKGNKDVILGKLQQRYGYNRMQAEDEYNRRMSEYEREQSSYTR